MKRLLFATAALAVAAIAATAYGLAKGTDL